MRTTALLLSTLLLVTACASHTPGQTVYYTGEHPETMGVTGFKDKTMSFGHFVVARLVFSNAAGDDWVRVKEVSFTPQSEDEAANVHVLLGSDLQTWSTSTREHIAVDNHNFETIAGSILLTAMILGAAASSKGQATTSLAVTSAALGALTAQGVGKRLHQLHTRGTLPEGHLLAPFSVPPGLASRRWIVLQKPVALQLSTLHFKVKYLDGREADYQVKL